MIDIDNYKKWDKGIGLMATTVLSLSVVKEWFLEVDYGWVVKVVDIEFF